jgi:hypothetical protein
MNLLSTLVSLYLAISGINSGLYSCNHKKEEVKWSLRNFVNLDSMYLTFEQITEVKRRLIDMNLQPEYMESSFSGSQED